MLPIPYSSTLPIPTRGPPTNQPANHQLAPQQYVAQLYAARQLPTQSPPTLQPATHVPIVRFIVGYTTQEFDVPQNRLAAWSLAFPRKISPSTLDSENMVPIVRVPLIAVEDFRTLLTWLYTGAKPNPTKASDLHSLMQLWIAASRLGLWSWMNTIMRLGMSLMQPRDFTVDIRTVLMVYKQTDIHSKLRPYIIALFAQRCKPTPEVFKRSSFTGILRDASRFMTRVPVTLPDKETLRRCEKKVTHAYRWGLDEKGLPIWVDTSNVSKKDAEKAQVLPDHEVWDIPEQKLPEYLVWGAFGETLPDAYFVTQEEALKTAWNVENQMKWLHAKGEEKYGFNEYVRNWYIDGYYDGYYGVWLNKNS